MSCLAGRFLLTETVLIKTNLDYIKTFIEVFVSVQISYDITYFGFRFFADEITDMSNDINDEMDLSGKSKHFLMERCEGENHSGDHVFARVLIKVSSTCRIRKVI